MSRIQPVGIIACSPFKIIFCFLIAERRKEFQFQFKSLKLVEKKQDKEKYKGKF